jgi:hypothetical protein
VPTQKCCGVSNNIQSAVNFEMRIPSKTYFKKTAILSFGGRIAGKIKRNTLNYNGITAKGRYLPREWGRDPFYTYAQGTNEGFGDVR